MKILVVLKQIPDAQLWEEYQNPGCLNDSDQNVLKEALDIREDVGGTVDVMALGPLCGEDVLKEALTYRIHRAILLSDPSYAGLDISGAGSVLGTAIRKLETYDLILCGRQAIDGDSAHMAAMVAGSAGVPLIPYARETRVEGNKIVSVCEGDQQDIRMECDMPVMVLSLKEEHRKRYPVVSDIMKTYSGEYCVEIIGNDRVGAKIRQSQVKQLRKYIPKMTREHQLQMLDGRNEEETAQKILEVLKNQSFL